MSWELIAFFVLLVLSLAISTVLFLLYAVVWGEHLVSEPYIYSYQTTEQVNGNVSGTITDQNGDTSTVSGTTSTSVPVSQTSSGTKHYYVADGWLAIWEHKTNESKGNFVPIAPLHNHNRTVLTSASTSLLKDAMEQISQREKVLLVAVNEKEPRKVVKGDRNNGHGWSEMTITPIKRDQSETVKNP